MSIEKIKWTKNQTVYSFVFSLFFLTVVGVIFYFGKVNKLELLTGHVDTENVYVSSFFKTFESQDTKALSATLDSVLQDPGFKGVFLRQNREELNQYGQPLFQKLKTGYGITHFYFMLPDGTTFLRLHNPNVFGDINNRITFKKASESKDVGFGIELGKTAFALRVVKPYYDGSKLIGYVELGQEIDHFLRVLKEETKNEYVIFVNKENLNKSDWEVSRKNNSKVNNWDSFSKMISTNSTVDLDNNEDERIKFCFTENNSQNFFSSNLEHSSIINLKLKMACSGFVIKDASGMNAGIVLFIHDLSDRVLSYGGFIDGINLLVLGLLILVTSVVVIFTRINQASENKFKVLFDSSVDAIMTLEPPDWKFTNGNKATLKLFGLKDLEQLQSVAPGDLSPEKQPDGRLSFDKAREMIDLALKNGSNVFEWNHKKLNGPEFVASVSLSKIDNSDVLQVIVKDITDEKTSFDKVKKSEAEARKALDETEKMNKLMVGRELEMVNLKKELFEIKNNK